MKKVMVSIVVVLLISLIASPTAKAEGIESIEDSVNEFRDSLSPDILERLDEIGMSDDDFSFEGLRISAVIELILKEIGDGLSGPLSSCFVMLCVIILSSILEGYTFSLRYTETKEIMTVVTSLMILTCLMRPILGLINSAVDVISGTSTLMLAYVPTMIGILAFSGHVISSGGYCATVLIAGEVISGISSRFLAPMLSLYTALSSASCISSRIKISGISDMLYNAIKWILTFLMALFTAVLSLQTALASAEDNLAARAARFTLSSLIPLVGASVSEAYKTISGSLGVLKSGLGILCIIAVFLSFFPVIIKTVLWLISVNLTRSAACALGTGAPLAVLASVTNVFKVMIALLVSVMSVFIISSAALMSISGGV